MKINEYVCEKVSHITKNKVNIKEINSDRIIYITFAIYMALLMIKITSMSYLYESVQICIKVIKYFCCAIFALKILLDWLKRKRYNISNDFRFYIISYNFYMYK